jgi:hypothetical protein
MATEANTCRTLITPKLQVAGWESDRHSVAEQRTFTDGQIAERHRIVAERDALPAEVDALKRLQAETAAELDALLPAILTSSRGYDATGDRADTRLHVMSVRREGEL